MSTILWSGIASVWLFVLLVAMIVVPVVLIAKRVLKRRAAK